MTVNRLAGLLGTFVILTCATNVAFAEETEVLFDGTRISDWDTARDQARLASEFSHSELAAMTNPPALRWRFTPKATRFNDIFLRKPVARPFSAIRLHLRNQGETCILAAKVGDARGAEWTTSRMEFQHDGEWQWVEFPAEQWKLASWSAVSGDQIAFPLTSVTLIAVNVRSGAEYEVQVSRVEAVRPDRPVAVVRHFAIPPQLVHGQSYAVNLRVELDKPCTTKGAWLVFHRGQTEAFRQPVPLTTPLDQWPSGQTLGLEPFQVSIPKYAFGGPYAVTLELGEAKVLWNGRTMDDGPCSVSIEARTPSRTTAALHNHHGSPTLFINGQPHDGMAYMAYRPSVPVFRDFAGAGVDLFSFSATPTEAGYGLSKTTWTAPGEYDFSQLDQRVMMVLEANPQAFFFPRLYLHAPKWWSLQHPNDVVQVELGDGQPIPLVHAGEKPAPSWTSPTWREDTIEGLRRLVAHVESSPYADRCIGYHIASGTTEEWMMWGANEDLWGDYSPVNLAAFREWLRVKYGTPQRLSEAWGEASTSFETVLIPAKPRRLHTEWGALRDPAKEQPVIDFYLFNSELVADTICHFATAIKEITKGEKVVGVFYGYTLQLCGEQRQQNAGHLALGKVLASPDIDFLCSPTSYFFRQVGGEGTSHFMSLSGSVRLHDKLWFDENDIRTSLSPGQPGDWGKPADVAGDMMQQDKELANVFVHGAAQWWFDVGGNRYDDPALMRRIGELTAKSSEVLNLDRTAADQVAMVVDEKSLCYLRPGDPLGAWLLVQQIPALSRIGSPVGHYLVTDVPRITDRRVFLLMTSFAPTAADRAAIDALKRDGHVLVFFYAPGIYRDGKLDEAAMADFTGITLRMTSEPTELRLELKPGHVLTDGLEGVSCGVPHTTFPTCYAADPAATILGTLPSGRAGLVVKPQQGWTAIFSAAPMLPAALLRRIARLGGVHEYIETEDVVWASREMVAVSVYQAGPRKIVLPHPATVRDVFNGAEITTSGNGFEAAFGARATRLFMTVPPPLGNETRK